MIRAALLLLALASAAAAQTRTAVSARAVTVGDRFLSVVEVEVPDGGRVEIALPVDTAARVLRIGPLRQATEQGMIRVTATLVAWTPGAVTAVPARARIVEANGDARDLTLRFPVPEVRSVLPRDTARLKPRPPKDVIGPDRTIQWLWVAAGAAAVAWLGVLWAWLRRRRRNRPQPVVAPADARAQALAALDAAGASGLAEQGDSRAFYTLLTGALRGFAHAVRPRWSPDLTTSELERRMARDGVAPGDLAPLRALLHTGDLAKFGRYAIPAATARRDLDEARRWVEAFGREERAVAPAEEVAR